MKMTKLTTAILAGSLLMAGLSASAEEARSPVAITGSAAFTTDYLFRGVSQTSNNAAVQAAMTATHESGVYFSLWGSSVSGANSTGGHELAYLGSDIDEAECGGGLCEGRAVLTASKAF